MELNRINSFIAAYFEKIIFDSTFDIEQNDEIDTLSLLKLGDFKLRIEENNYLEMLIKFLKILVELCGIKVIFITELHSFFEDSEIEVLYKEVCLNKINIINVEHQQFDNKTNDRYKEIVYIFDKENCEI